MRGMHLELASNMASNMAPIASNMAPIASNMASIQDDNNLRWHPSKMQLTHDNVDA